MKKAVKNKTPESASERIKRKLEGAARGEAAAAASAAPAPAKAEKPKAPAAPKVAAPKTAVAEDAKAPPAPKAPKLEPDTTGARKLAYQMERARKLAEREKAAAPKAGVIGKLGRWMGGLLGGKGKAAAATAAPAKGAPKAKTGAGKGA